MKETLLEFLNFIKPYSFDWDSDEHKEKIVNYFLSRPITLNDGFDPPPWNMYDHPEKTEEWIVKHGTDVDYHKRSDHMKICDRCMEEYEGQEIIKFKEWPSRYVCIPCDCEFKRQFEQLVIDFFVTPS